MNPLLLVDFYKSSHYFMYPKGMTKLYSKLLTTVFKDGKLVKETSLDEIRAKLNGK